MPMLMHTCTHAHAHTTEIEMKRNETKFAREDMCTHMRTHAALALVEPCLPRPRAGGSVPQQAPTSQCRSRSFRAFERRVSGGRGSLKKHASVTTLTLPAPDTSSMSSSLLQKIPLVIRALGATQRTFLFDVCAPNVTNIRNVSQFATTHAHAQ